MVRGKSGGQLIQRVSLGQRVYSFKYNSRMEASVAKIESMNSRERLLAAIEHRDVDHVPCSFMLYKSLLTQSHGYSEFIQRQIAMGLDAFVQLPPRAPVVKSDSYNLHGLPVSFHKEVTTREWKETISGEKWPVLFKAYDTPAGKLTAEVFQDPEWPYDEHVPFLDDHLESRAHKYLITTIEELGALRYLLVPPNEKEITNFKEESRPLQEFAAREGLLVAGGWGVGADMLAWLYGLEHMMFAVYDRPDLLDELLDIVYLWNQNRMQVVLDAGIDLYIKRAWYENCDFWTPDSWRRYIYPMLKGDVDLAHDMGAKFGYLITANCMPLLEDIYRAGVDVIIGVDPAKWDLVKTHDILGGKVCLWGGVNGHLAVEQGSEDQVRQQVCEALDIFKQGGGFILSPVDNIRENTALTNHNVEALIDEWQKTN